MYVKKIDHKGLLSWAFCGTIHMYIALSLSISNSICDV